MRFSLISLLCCLLSDCSCLAFTLLPKAYKRQQEIRWLSRQRQEENLTKDKDLILSNRLYASPSGNDSPENDSQAIPDANVSNFNPFAARDTIQSFTRPQELDYSKAVSSSNRANTISIRKMQMQKVLEDLLEADPRDMKIVLTTHKNAVLAPFVDTATFVDDDPDSIYTTNMSASDRFRAYVDSMEERIAKARNPTVRAVLQAMLDFVQEQVGDAES